jgi:hypothetical protein
LTVAVIIEMIHLATLVHDDVIDEAQLRRGRLTLAANWGNEVSVLLGDCLFAHALKLAASFPTPEICRAAAGAANTVCAGEILQSRSRGDFDVSRGHYFKMLAMKTGELFALSCDLGGYVSEASERGGTPCANTAWLWARPISCTTIAWMCSVRKPRRAKRWGGPGQRENDAADHHCAGPGRRGGSGPLAALAGQLGAGFLAGVVELMVKYEAFAESRLVIQQYLWWPRAKR